MNRQIISLVGHTCSGKSRARDLLLDDEVAYPVRGDDWYWGRQRVPEIVGASGATYQNWEDPVAVELTRLADDMKKLQEGAVEITVPIYERGDRHERVGWKQLKPHPEVGRRILLDSMFAAYAPVVDVVDLVVCIDAPPMLCERRRSIRDEGLDPDYWTEVIRPNFDVKRPIWRDCADFVVAIYDEDLDESHHRAALEAFWKGARADVVFVHNHEENPEKRQLSARVAALIRAEIEKRCPLD